MGAAGRYAELSAAARSFKAELIRPSQAERLIEAGSLSEIVGMMTEGRITHAEGTDTGVVEAFLTQRVTELARRLAGYAPQDSRSLIKLFATHYELDCVKVILGSITDHIQPEQALEHFVPVGKFTEERCKELIEARNLSRVIEMIDDSSMKLALAQGLTAEKGAMAAVARIDQYYYTRLWSSTNLPDPLDAQSARGLIGEFIDQLNILLAFRARLMNLDARSTLDLMIPVNYALGRSLNELAESTSTQNVLRVIEKTPYSKALQGSSLSDGIGASVERALSRAHAISCLNSFAGSPFNVGLALALLFLKNYELRDLFAILNGRANNAPLERVLDSLILRVS
jgi:vacuolar-type H+-ATPase subunit C/Vma6